MNDARDQIGPPVRTLRSEDGWLLAASALRHAALDAPSVADLSSSAAFQTRGRGPHVAGVALAPRGDGAVQADVGLVLALSGTEERLDAALHSVEQRLYAAWARFGEASPLDLRLHVLDLALPSEPVS